ncbi:MAG: phospholipase [Pseudonocardiaceae bacterium]
MTQPGSPVTIRWGSRDPAAPLVVLFHGRHATETDMTWFARYLPEGAAYASVRAPLADGRGFAWFADGGVGRPLPDSLAVTMTWFREWLDEWAAPPVPVVLVGFSHGAVFAGGLLLADPPRFAAAGLLYGTLPFDVGVPLTRGRLAGVPVFVTHGVHDTVIPVELQRRTWDYLVQESGSPLWAQREPTGHAVTAKTVSELAGWIEARLGYLQQHDAVADRAADREPRWATLPDGLLPARPGPPPEVSVTTPQQQESQNAPTELQEALFSRVAMLPGVAIQPSAVSVPGARAFVLGPGEARGPADAFMVADVGEFAHLHPGYDGSLHLVLPIPLAHDALAKGWAVAHPLSGLRMSAGLVLIFGPRNPMELEIITAIARTSHSYASQVDPHSAG